MERCESDGKSSFDLFKIDVRHCCGKEVFEVSLHPCSRSLLPATAIADHGLLAA